MLHEISRTYLELSRSGHELRDWLVGSWNISSNGVSGAANNVNSFSAHPTLAEINNHLIHVWLMASIFFTPFLVSYEVTEERSSLSRPCV